MPFFTNSNNSKRPLTAAVIGTGFSGICAAIKLEKELGIKAQVFELWSDVAGTWFANRYPGAECDIPSHLYSFSFEQNPDWSKNYSSQPEIYAYLQGVARKYHLYDRIKFETKIVRAEWKEQQQQWCLVWRNTNDHQQTASAYFDVVVSGVGALRIPNIPKEFSGFEGPIVHTTFWDSNLDYTNKRIAVIGSGASAVQVIPELQKVASHVYSYQRTPAWVLPRDQYLYSRTWKFIFRYVPFVLRFYRLLIFIRHELTFVNFGYHKLLGKVVKKKFIQGMVARLTAAGRADLISSVVPDYPVGCKRITKSEHYLEALAKANVTVTRSGIEEIRGRTLLDKDGNETEVDILVLATGFHVNDMNGNLKIYGRNGVLLQKVWDKENSKSYKSVTVHGFPNFFLLLGPSSGLGHNSIVTVIEVQTDYTIQCVKRLVKNDLAAIEPKKAAQEEFVANVQKGFEGTVWKAGCRSWYMNDKGEIYTLWNGPITTFWWALRQPVFKDFIEYKKNALAESK
ncbi:putative flavin-binding monooxygenase [Zychaea mexicana]|uniref:putative flavin-binding monooxygenase n=1 Tax=Zychaea mexicana TaxID=64656 RepID=UPI0022FE2F4E|nr:putative flavin-binding monooxygenase [Zychaea mexicana]KAI9493839.1 putative flavin-binding monooxygenase [Zychaea mexicana]